MRKFAHHVDSLDVSSGRIVVGLSALEGNVSKFSWFCLNFEFHNQCEFVAYNM